MKYRIRNTRTGELENEYSAVLTQSGDIAWWDESQGWNDATYGEDTQENYQVEYCIKGEWVDADSVEDYCSRLL